MDALRQRRTPLRGACTRVANALEELTNSDNPNGDELAGLMGQLEEKGKKLDELEEEIMRCVQSAGGTDADVEREFDSAEAYRDRIFLLKTKAGRMLTRIDERARLVVPNSREEVPRNGQRKYRLPEIELKKFDGSPKDWLGFWGQFNKIHVDPDLDLEDKFQYLLQATVVHSKARELVESFPPTAANYTRAVEHLKRRFGREETLVEVYVRELLRLVINNALKQKSKDDLAELYDKLETQLRALETLGVTSDKYASMLYPLVEACLPEDSLRAWERNRVSSVNGEGVIAPLCLKSLMNFLRGEVDGEERVRMARSGFGISMENRKRATNTIIQPELAMDVPTAAGLVSSTARSRDPKSCVFCEKMHNGHECRQAARLSLSERKRILFQKGCCFACLKPGHLIRNCKASPRCTRCAKAHHDLMCPETFTKEISLVSSRPLAVPGQDSLANLSCTTDVLLQTLTVVLRGPGGDQVARALIDSGSQRSYITEKAAGVMKYGSLGRQSLIHNLFGGAQSSLTDHERHRIFISSIGGQYKCNFEVLTQATICGNIRKVPHGPWIQALKTEGIVLTDLERANHKSPMLGTELEIDVLIGADIAGKLLTGRIQRLKAGLVAVETLLGWVLMGRTPNTSNSEPSCASFVTTLLTHESTVADRWRHVPGSINPADLASRGCSVKQLTRSKWWEGPEWLYGPKESWPILEVLPEDTVVNAERKKTVISTLVCTETTQWSDKFSCFWKIIRVKAWMNRFCHNARSTLILRRQGPLTMEEIDKAEIATLKGVQEEAFKRKADQNIRSLQILQDQDGLLRVKTKILLRDDTQDFRYPILLPSKHRLVTLLVQRTHKQMSHGGVQLVMTTLRERFWILKGRQVVKKVLRQCGRCRRYDASKMEVVPCPLPVGRVRDSEVFATTGVDLTGPLTLRGGNKSWIVIFTCAVYRAVHLELVSSLSTDAFLQAFRWFLARRGRPLTMHSDNGTNFVGADNAFKRLNWEDISDHTTAQRIAWWRGWGERLVGVLKRILRRVLGRAFLTY